MTRFTAPTVEALAALDRYASKAPPNTSERALLIMAFLADRCVVTESNGANRGPWVDFLIRESGLDPRDRPSWCAITLCFATKRAGCWSAKSARVIDWYRKAKAEGRLRSNPARGLACVHLNKNADGSLKGTGHIGDCVAGALGWTKSIEGNTSPGDAGSQGDGDGLYRKTRRNSFWDGWIELSQENR